MVDDEIDKGVLVRMPSHVFGRDDMPPVHTPDMLNWIEGNHAELEHLIDEFDGVIRDFNGWPIDDEYAQYWDNFHDLKNALHGQELPTVRELLEEPGYTPIRAYGKVLKTIKERMYQGQLSKDERTGPTLGYHQTNTDPRSLVIAGIFHTYEMLLRDRPQFRSLGPVREDTVVEALMEVSTESLSPELFDALASKDGMNWVDGAEVFNPEFRHEHNFN